jgi:hypothetical protein
MKTKIAAYEKILKLVTEEISKDRIELSKSTLETVIENLKVSEKFGIPLQSVTNNHVGWLKVGKRYDDFIILGRFGENHGRTISWSDSGKQPRKTGEWLLSIRFPTGAYIFGDGSMFDKSYPKKTFDMFFKDLKGYQPKFCDAANHCLYFTDETAKAVYDDFYVLFDKYKGLVQDEMKAQRKEKLLKELEELSND